jgi:hypothetical protein
MTLLELQDWYRGEVDKPLNVYRDGEVHNPAYIDWLERRFIQLWDKRSNNEHNPTDKEKCIDFGKWYSGMNADAVINAYERYLKEKG